MKKYSCIFLAFTILFFSIFIGCGVEPDEPPSLMEVIVGKYSRVLAQIDDGSFMGSVILNSEVDSTTHLTISQDFRFILYFKCTLQNSDSTIIISQEGSFEIPVSHYMEDPGEYGTYKYYSGVIWFYPENTVKWGGKFNYGIDYNMVSFPDRPKLIANDKVGVLFWNWEK